MSTKRTPEAEARDIVTVSVVVPTHNSANTLRDCLTAIYQSDYPHYEVIVADDDSEDNSEQIASTFPCRMVRVKENRGAAAARNEGTELAIGDVLVFVDSDILISKDAMSSIVKVFEEDPTIAALFGSYASSTPARNFASVYKNLYHHFTHQTSKSDSGSFWTGCGAIRKEVFKAVGGFDESYAHCGVEDIELGNRLKKHGFKILLKKDLQVIHLKERNLWGLIHFDVCYTASRWTELMLETKSLRNDLNTTTTSALGLLTAYIILFLSLGLMTHLLPSGMVMLLVASVIFFLFLNRGFYLFAAREMGGLFLLKAILMNYFFYLYCALGLSLGVFTYLKKRLGKA